VTRIGPGFHGLEMSPGTALTLLAMFSPQILRSGRRLSMIEGGAWIESDQRDLNGSSCGETGGVGDGGCTKTNSSSCGCEGSSARSIVQSLFGSSC
jgi:hypothetical protein